jgi:hypothetical protein
MRTFERGTDYFRWNFSEVERKSSFCVFYDSDKRISFLKKIIDRENVFLRTSSQKKNYVKSS